ncbi:hypothetical protein BKA62DRAFT_618237, partial [Auriculariales sp. MPI-PUGE-AT-0066]
IIADLESTVFPSWMAKGPAGFGSPAHGTMSAADVRTIGVYHVSLTLTRLWGLKEEDSRERKLLHNFMNLVEAVDLALRRVTSRKRLHAVGKHAASYLVSSRKLFPWIDGTTNEHLMLHQPELLNRFGPARYWWCFAGERLNGALQNTTTNHILGVSHRLRPHFEAIALPCLL